MKERWRSRKKEVEDDGKAVREGSAKKEKGGCVWFAVLHAAKARLMATRTTITKQTKFSVKTTSITTLSKMLELTSCTLSLFKTFPFFSNLFIQIMMIIFNN
jgi:hypothetical protein